MPLETKEINGLEIFAVGTHNGDTYTEADLDAMVTAFNEVGFQPPVKAGHADGQEDEKEARRIFGAPALGYVSRIYRQGKKLLADIVDIPKRFADLIKAGAYRRVSAEVYWNYHDANKDKTFPRVLRAVAFLGADIPAITDLKAVESLYRKTDAGALYAYDEQKNEYRVYDMMVEPVMAAAYPKKDKVQVEYKMGDGAEKCATCKFYQHMQCALVEGEIDPHALCNLYEPRSYQVDEGRLVAKLKEMFDGFLSQFRSKSVYQEHYPWEQCVKDRMKDGYDEETAKKICAAIKNRTVQHALDWGMAKTEREAIDLISKKMSEDKFFAYAWENFCKLAEGKLDVTEYKKWVGGRVSGGDADNHGGKNMADEKQYQEQLDALTAKLQEMQAALEAQKRDYESQLEAKTKAAAEALQKENEELRKNLERINQEKEEAEIKAWIRDQKASGKLLPVEEKKVFALLKAVRGMPKVVTYANDKGESVDETPEETLRSFIEGRKPHFLFREFSRDTGEPAEGWSHEKASDEVNARVKEYMKTSGEKNYKTAFRAVLDKDPELRRAYEEESRPRARA